MDNYVQFRTSDQDWVCGVWVSSDEKSVTVEDVRSIDVIPLEETGGKFGVVFIPYTVTDPDIPVKFYRQHIISEVNGQDSKMYGVYVEHMAAWKEIEDESPTSNILSIVPVEGTTDDPV